jgi:hypothetical protein
MAHSSPTFMYRDAVPDHAIEVLDYAARHGYTDVMDLAAKSSLNLALEDVFAMNVLGPSVLIAWVGTRTIARAALN